MWIVAYVLDPWDFFFNSCLFDWCLILGQSYLELTLELKLVSNSQEPSFFSLLHGRIVGFCHLALALEGEDRGVDLKAENYVLVIHSCAH